MKQPETVSAPFDRLAEVAARLVVAGPVLVVADTTTVGRLAPRWARDFAAAGRVHRVRVGGDGAAITAEIRGMGATVVAGAGPADLLATVASCAAAAGVPCVCGTDGTIAAPPPGGHEFAAATSP